MPTYATIQRIIEYNESNLVIVEWGNGGTGVLDYPDNLKLKAGQAVLVDRGDEITARLKPIGDDRGNAIGVVDQLLGDRAIVKIGGRYTIYEISDGISVDRGNTVEISRRGIIKQVVDRESLIDDSSNPSETDIEDYVNSLKYPSSELDVGYEDFGGMSDRLWDLRRRVDILLNSRKKMEDIGVKPRLGAVFYGTSGTGKTHFARILASESDATFYNIRGPEIITKWIGDTEEILRELFKDARTNEPSILFFDEIDSLGSERSSGPNQQFSNRIVAQLLSLIDGIEQNSERLMIIGSTNRIKDMDDALLRSGRLNWKVEFEKPNREARVEIFNALKKGYSISNSIDPERVADITKGWTGAELESLLDEAGIASINSGRKKITMTDLRISHEKMDGQA